MLADLPLVNVSFVEGNITQLGTAECPVGTQGKLFDFIESRGVLHHLPDPEAGLRALNSVLKPTGGILLMLCTNTSDPP